MSKTKTPVQPPSKEELKKWENKLKLFKVLHPNFCFIGWCGPEDHICLYKKNKDQSCSFGTGKNRIWVNEQTLELEFKLDRNKDYPPIGIGFAWYEWCAEWIKYV